jgi:hypothetical protein
VQRMLSLQRAVIAQLTAHGQLLTRANLVTAMESAASVDLTGTTVLPELLTAVPSSGQPPTVQAMLATLQAWMTDGALRLKANPTDTQYADAAGVAIMDELYPAVVETFFDHLFTAGGVATQLGLPSSYNVVPEGFSQNPNQTGGGGSSYYGGLQSQVVKALRQLNGETVAQPFSATTLAQLCGGGGLGGCSALLNNALLDTYTAMSASNGGSTTPATWTANAETQSGGAPMPQLDAISFAAVGIATQPNIDWQNRPTFQQVVEFTGAPAVGAAEVPSPLLLVPAAGITALVLRRRRTARHPTGVQPAA